ncbi:GNAT family N-acetyltransferase [Lentzea flaviverrucosa]|uniref:Ribosomal protein S18 acetylase RimI n=1 Tax=Lentzea flaviverrucosa TaxID=200379 RepID=A0A1H9XL07_9PSEU|nr:GNAT family N-acetyltransferase [Lentzea flaviverrucosa]RDI20351.1 ribosomal protein S18 acetylase RimI-like enzyme [Lentzea flaviverrucosa]SES46719.1 Ribosomal protein S18 acetylase RimI [Lentzea flaviverrucosa]
MEIVQGGPEDVDTAALLWAHAVAARDGYDEVPSLALARPGLESALAKEPSLLLLAREGGRAVGFLAGGPQETNTAFVNYVGVHPDAWGKGVGEALLRALPEVLIKNGYERAELMVYVDNVRGVRLYERLGWIKVGHPVPHPRDGRVEQRYAFSPASWEPGV